MLECPYDGGMFVDDGGEREVADGAIVCSQVSSALLANVQVLQRLCFRGRGC